MLRSLPRALRAALLLVAVASPAAAETPPVLDWAQLWNGPDNHDDEAVAVAVDPGGDVLVAGTTYQLGVGGNREDFALLRYAPDGTLLWFRRFGGLGADVPSTVIIPEPGKTLVAGRTRDGAQDNATVLLYDVGGTLLWERHFPLTGNQPLDLPPRLARADDGSLYLCATSNADYLVIKMDAAGNALWTRSYAGPEGGADVVEALAVDASGAVVVTGLLNSDSFPFSYGTVKYDADGVLQWEQFESGEFGSLFEFVGVGIAPGGDVLLAGNPESACGLFETRVWRLNGLTGELQWLQSFPSNPCDTVEPTAMAVDAQGNLLVTGYGRLGSAGFHIHTLKYDGAGQLLWHQEYDGPGSSSDLPSSLVVDVAGDVYVAGLTINPPQDRDHVAVKYAPDGAEAWRLHWPGPFDTNDGATAIALGPDGAFVMAGHAYDPAHQEELTTLHYTQQDVTAAPPAADGDAPRVWAVGNPFHGETRIGYALPAAGTVRLSVHDVTGRRLAVLRDGPAAAGAHTLVWRGEDDAGRPLPAGVYLLRLEAAGVTRGARVQRLR
ncbi:hypothetical protein KDL67_06820 [bacterium]|nr:hypothetical protein [bacterium]